MCSVKKNIVALKLAPYFPKFYNTLEIPKRPKAKRVLKIAFPRSTGRSTDHHVRFKNEKGITTSSLGSGTKALSTWGFPSL